VAANWARRALPLRAYFAALFVLVLLAAIGGALYVDRALERDARAVATQSALHSATTASAQLSDYVVLLRASPAQLAANPQIAAILAQPAGCTLTFQGLGGPDRGHLDLIRPDGTVACSSRKLTPQATRTGYAGSEWLARALTKPLLLAPRPDALGGAQVAISSAPIPGGKGAVVAFADLAALGPHLAEQYGGGRATLFTVTSADGRTVISRSQAPERWIGTRTKTGSLDVPAGTERRDLNGTTRLYAQATVPGAGWKVYVGEDKATALASVSDMRTRQLQVIGFTLAALLLLIALIYRKVVTPIRRLSNSVRSDAPESVPVSGPAEVRALAEDVNTLTESVHRELRERGRAEESYRLLFESNPHPMYVYDAASTAVVAVNDAALECFGYSRAEFLALSVESLASEGERERLRAATTSVQDGSRSGLTFSGVWRAQRKDGSEIDVDCTTHDHVFDGKRARVVMALDVTERMEAERALRASEARYRDLFENANDLITAVDLDGRLTAVNEAFVRATGYSREELIGKPIAELVPAGSQAAIASARGQKLDGAESTVYDSELLARDGHLIRVEVSSRLIFENGQPVGTEAIGRDISDRLELEEQLRQAQRLEAIGRLAGGVAHDFNNLLTVISGYTETLLEESDRSSEPELTQIAAAADRAAILTRQLLAFSRRQVLQPRVLELNGVVEGITPMLSRLIGEDLELVASLAPGLDRVLADPNQLEQVLLNLAVNARDAMPDGGVLTIQTANVELDDEYVAHHGESNSGQHVMLAISDTGTGMDADTLSHVFEPFFTTKSVGTGTGLGLATVYGIVKQSGGSIWVYSELGKGTTFKVYLPVTESAVADDEPRAAGAPAPTGSETILLAEDEEPLRRLTATLLERHGYVVIAAESADEALLIAEENSRRIDLLLTDLIMPGLSGAAVAERVTELVPGVKVLFMSGYADNIVVRNGNLSPGAAFLEKPFSAGDLAAKVRETLDNAA
jgi:two-component system, cell cycle sensor histidine kinase and response regulator CckA